MGRTPPPGLINAVKGAPQNHGATRQSSLPERRTLTQRVKACKHPEAAGAVLPQTASRRCWGRRPKLPGEVPLGKERKAAKIVEDYTTRGGGTSEVWEGSEL